ncbi:MAG: tyrosine-type recombinase/integrase [Helicobacteraceae bacterium]|jgi:integrase|nr:tyrosine-type recombinase/integrase [Helicobacteraceae bacterium]
MFEWLKRVVASPSFKEIAEQYLDDLKAKSSYRMSRQRINQIADRIGNKRANAVVKADILAIMDEKAKEGKAPATINHYRQLTKTIYLRATSRGYALIDPTIGIDPLPVDNARQGFLMPAECKRLLKSLARSKNRKLYLLALLLITTGARCSTVLSIRGVDCDLERGVIYLYNSKSARGYIAYIARQTRAHLEKAIAALDDPYHHLIGGAKEKCGAGVIRALQRRLNRLFNKPRGIDRRDRKNRIVVHSLRHSFGSNLAMASVSPFAIARLMDHKSVSQTHRYAKIADVQMREAVGSLVKSVLE